MAAPAFPRSVGANVAYIAPVAYHQALPSLVDKHGTGVDLVDVKVRGVGEVAEDLEVHAVEAGVRKYAESGVVTRELDTVDCAVLQFAAYALRGIRSMRRKAESEKEELTPVHESIISKMRRPPPQCCGEGLSVGFNR